ncbi:MAG: M48 family metalloprotease, partial [Rhodospirillaceae bacterium]|nr:M48 family metalloprotease [Rhodospirillaceae bacterium]
MAKPRVLPVILAASMVLALVAPWAHAQGRGRPLPRLIRDAEIETIIRSYATPIFEAAGLDPTSVHVVLLQDDTVNAFVAGGMNLFINVGLITASENAGQIIGVIAHETGHIAGGHLARRLDEMRGKSLEQMLALALGVGAAAASGEGGAAAAVVSAASTLQQASLSSFSRTQETSADQAGLALLDRTGQSARPLLEFLRLLERKDKMSPQPDLYMRTHPLTEDRIRAVEEHVARSPYSDVPEPAAFEEAHRRMKAKLIGFLQPLDQVLRDYPPSDGSLPARYARAIAYWRGGQLPKSLETLQSLLDERPDDPYFNELMGQILFQSGRGAAALPYYEKSVRLAPDQPQIRLGLAQAQVEIGDPALIKAAIPNLEQVLRAEPTNALAWRTLSIAYGRDGQLPMAALALAEAAQARGDRKEARAQADRALRGLPEGSPAAIRAQDILNAAKPQG